MAGLSRRGIPTGGVNHISDFQLFLVIRHQPALVFAMFPGCPTNYGQEYSRATRQVAALVPVDIQDGSRQVAAPRSVYFGFRSRQLDASRSA